MTRISATWVDKTQMHSFHTMSKKDAFWSSVSEQFFEIGIAPFSFSLRILAFSRKFTKYGAIHLKWYFFLLLSVFKTSSKAWRKNSKASPNSRKENKLSENKRCLCSSVFIKWRDLLTKGNTIQCSCCDTRSPVGFGSPTHYIHITKCKPYVLTVKPSPYIHVIKW